MLDAVLRLGLADESATQLLGADVALALRAGDVLLLKGDLGAGKTTLARALIRTMADDPALEVPSPTFTLVQAYDLRVPIRHVDLYRLSSPDELEELGLDEAVTEGAVLVEWPERAEARLPGSAVTIELSTDGDARIAEISGHGPGFDRIARSLAIRAFLTGVGWGEARRRLLTGDASARSYETVEMPGEPVRMLMNSPRLVLGPPVRDGKPYAEIAHTAQTVHAFVAVDQVLRQGGFAAPEIHAADLNQGFLLIEHLGEETLVEAGGRPIPDRYVAAGELLADLHAQRWRYEIEVAPGVAYSVPPFDREAMLIEAELLPNWYLPAMVGRPANTAEQADFRAAWNVVLDRIAKAETTLMLRDVQSPNFIWRGERSGHARLGLIDFQDALIGPSAYDVASLALDPRTTIDPPLEAEIVAAYVARRRANGAFDANAFAAAYAIMGAQRHTKILGIFVRLDRRDGKPQYLAHLPRIRAYLARTLSHPALREVRVLYEAIGVLDAVSA